MTTDGTSWTESGSVGSREMKSYSEWCCVVVIPIVLNTKHDWKQDLWRHSRPASDKEF